MNSRRLMPSSSPRTTTYHIEWKLLCVTAKWRTRLPLWVNSGHLQCKKACPLYPRKQTCAVQLDMSALGQKRTHAAQQKGSLFDHLVGAGEQGCRYID